MIKVIRRLFLLAAVAGAGVAGWVAVQRRKQAVAGSSGNHPAAGGRSEQVPFAFTEIVEETVVVAAGQDPGEAPVEAPTWVPPVDGACPPGFPIKANSNSMIYHVEGGRFYDRTVAERCYARPADAEADGYRASKS